MIKMETEVTLKQAYLIMFAYLEKYWERVGKPEDLGLLLSDLSLWDTESGRKEPMDGAVFTEFLSIAQEILSLEATPEGYRGADMLLNGKPPTIKVKR